MGRLKARLGFRVGFARICYGGGPLFSIGRSKPGEDPTPGEDAARLICEVYPWFDSTLRHQLARHLGSRPARAEIRRHDTDGLQHWKGVPMRGSISTGEIPADEHEKAQRYVDIYCLLPPAAFDAVVSALVVGGKDLLARCRLWTGLMEDDLSTKQEGDITYLVDEVAVTFDIGAQYEEPPGAAQEAEKE